MYTKCRYRRTGTHFVGQESRCWVIQQQNWSGWNSTCSQILHCVLESRIRIHPTYYQVLLLLKWRCMFGIMSMFHDIEWTKRGNTETCLHNAGEVAAFATKFKLGHWCFLGPASENTLWNGHSPRTSRNMWYCQIANGWPIQVSYFPPNISSDRAIIAWTVEERKKKFTSPWYIRKQEDSHHDHIGKQFSMYFQSNLPTVWYWKSGSCTQKSGRRNQSPTRAVGIDYAKTAKHATSLRRLDATTHRESRDADSDSFRTEASFAWTVENGQFCITNEILLWMETALHIDAENTPNQEILRVGDYKQFLPIMPRSDQWLELKWLKYKYHHNN